ncbi:hydrolase [Streptomyces sp. 4N509B]|uniref:hydrolase n=1 Tax=Streptomyces sp. 4N509B TaxID=3457413 RepID=UPI003FD0A878
MPDRSPAADSPVLVLSGPRLADGRAVDVRLGGGRIEAVGTAGSLTGPGGPTPRGGGRTPLDAPRAPGSPAAQGPAGPPGPSGPTGRRDHPDRPGTPDAPDRLDLRDYLLLPAPVEPHAHHDTALTDTALTGSAPPRSSPAALRRRVTEAALLQLGHGATAQRTHVRIGDVHGLTALDAVLTARRALRGFAELTAVAVPRLLTGRDGADNRALLGDAVRMGAGAVGGAPDLDPDPAGHLDVVLGLADERGLPVDLHTEAGDPARLARLASAVAASRSAVTIGPCTGLSRLTPQAAARAADQLAAAGVTVACLPQGRCGGGFGGGRHGTPVGLLTAAGVRVAAGSGTLRDAANPVGRGDPLEAAYLLASQSGLSPLDAYLAVSRAPRAALGLPDVRIEPGFPAELIAVRAPTVTAALSLAYSRIVIHRGRIVARTSAVREYGGVPAVPGPPGRPGGRGLPRQATGEFP